jgi:hypothetical protein
VAHVECRVDALGEMPASQRMRSSGHVSRLQRRLSRAGQEALAPSVCQDRGGTIGLFEESQLRMTLETHLGTCEECNNGEVRVAVSLGSEPGLTQLSSKGTSDPPLLTRRCRSRFGSDKILGAILTTALSIPLRGIVGADQILRQY